MKLIDARDRFERKRAASAFGGRVALEGIARTPEAIDVRTLRRYRDARLESEHLIAQVDELNSWAARLKEHSELLERETRTLLRQLESSLRVQSRIKRDISRP